MIDWHAHVLPGIDDGSRDLGESLALLDALSEQGIDCVIATPHFYANENSVDEFLKKRAEAYKKLKLNKKASAPTVLCGAEVKYYQGISNLEGLEKLKIGSTDMLLLEMPFHKWSESVISEVKELIYGNDTTVVLAHIERYMQYNDMDVFEELASSGILMQSNASFFNEFGSRRKALKLLESGLISFVGSDCHNMTSRPPHMATAYEHIKKRFGEDTLYDMYENGCKAILRRQNF